MPRRGGRRGQRWRLGVRLSPRGAGRRMFPEDHLRSRRTPLLQVRAPDGPTRETRAGRRRRRGASKRRAAARAVRTRPRGGKGSGGGGKRTPCVANAKGSDTGCQLRFRSGNCVWRPWKTFISSLRRMQVGSLVVALPRRLPSTAGPLRGHRPAEAPSALHHLICRASFDTWRHGSANRCRVLKGRPADYPGKL